MKKILLYGLLVILLVLIGTASFFTFSELKRQQVDKKSVSNIDTQITNLVSKQGNPMSKLVAENKQGFLYEIYGHFVEKPIIPKGRADKVLLGDFIIEGDPMERRIPVYLGLASGQVLLGIFKDSFESQSNWKAVAIENFLEQLLPDEKVKLVADYSYEGGGKTPDYIFQAQEILDTLSKEFSSNKFVFQIPQGFYLIGTGVGIVRQ